MHHGESHETPRDCKHLLPVCHPPLIGPMWINRTAICGQNNPISRSTSKLLIAWCSSWWCWLNCPESGSSNCRLERWNDSIHERRTENYSDIQSVFNNNIKWYNKASSHFWNWNLQIFFVNETIWWSNMLINFLVINYAKTQGEKVFTLTRIHFFSSIVLSIINSQPGFYPSSQ